MLIIDTECYKNYFLLMAQRDDGKIAYFEMHNDSPTNLRKALKLLQSDTLISFNGNGYDLPMLAAFVGGFSNIKLKTLSDYLINTDGAAWKYKDQFNLTPVDCDHIDLIQVAPGQAGLKIYGGRLGTRLLQDLPIEPDDKITADQCASMRQYCTNDLTLTAELYQTLTQQIALRVEMSERYSVDLRSKSDAQIAETVIASELKAEGISVKKPIIPPGTVYIYPVPAFITFNTPELQHLLSDVRGCEFVINDKGSVLMPPTLSNRKIRINGSAYKMGIGGLHSCESSQTVICPEGGYLIDRDVASYYPSIILGENLFPQHLGDKFLTLYRRIVRDRLAAKASGDKVTADCLKIVLNGSFGKFGSRFSVLYSPDLLIRTTITGQLALLMLIERVITTGAQVVSANTDGVVILCADQSTYNRVNDAVFAWEITCGYETEETTYLSLHSDSVNNYIAVKPSGHKGKGRYAAPGLMKNPVNVVCVEAVAAYLVDGESIADHIRAEQDVRKFLTLRTVKGGAVKDDQVLGKSIRWYYAAGETGCIHYRTNNNRVPRSEGAKPLLNLPGKLPTDINYQWYIAEAEQMLRDMGADGERKSDRENSSGVRKIQRSLDL